MLDDIEEVLVSEDEIKSICKKIGQQISTDYKSSDTPVLVGLLKGCAPFMMELAKNITIPIYIDFMAVSSYHGGIQSSGDIQIKKDLDNTVLGKNVIIAEDIVDTGKTLKTICELLTYRGAKSVEVVTLLDKPEGRLVEFKPKYVGKEVPNKFVVGYGLDYNEFYRNLPFVGVLKRSVYEK